MKKYILTLFILIASTGISYSAETNIVKKIQGAYELYSEGNFEEAAPIFEDAYNITLKNGKNDVLGLFKLAVYSGLSYRGMEDYQKASLWFDKSLAIAAQMKDKAIAAPILAYMAESERLAGNYNKAVSAYLRAISSAFISQRDKSVLYFGLAESYRLRGDYDKAKDACGMAAGISGAGAYDQLKLSCDIIKGESYRISGDYAAALQDFGMVLDLARARQYPDLTIEALGGMGLTAEALGKKDSARANFEEVISLSIKNEIYDNVEATVEKLISMTPKGNFIKQAAETAALMENNDISDPFIKNALSRLISAYYRASDDKENALTWAENAYSELAATGQTEAPGPIYDMASLMFDMQRYYSAIIKLDEAIAEGKAAKYANMGKLYALKAECLSAMQKYKEAYENMKEAVKYDVTFSKRLSEMEKMASPASTSNKTPEAGAPETNPSKETKEQTNPTIETDETPIG